MIRALTAIVPVFSVSAVVGLCLSSPSESARAESVSRVLAQAQASPAGDFGSPPPGDYPILYNDQHIYSTPDEMKQNRLLSALVRGGEILVPLRSMFEQMGASVSYAAAPKTISVKRPDTDIELTVGKHEVLINGESRPIDVPAELYHGVVMVPVRVLSEALGAYVLWVPEKKTIVVRYVAPSPSPTPATPAPTQAPTSAPTPTAAPTASAKKQAFEAYVAASSVLSSKVSNELVSRAKAKAFDIKGAVEIPFRDHAIMIGGDSRRYRYDHLSNFGAIPCPTSGSPICSTVVGSDFNYLAGTCPNNDPGCVTVIGYPAYVKAIGLGQAYYPAATDEDRDSDGRVGVRVLPAKLYVGASFLVRKFDYLGYPTQHGIGFGIDKLPDLSQALSWYGSIYYYPTVKGTYTGPTSALLGSLSGARFSWTYSVYKYDLGLTLDFPHTPIFIQAGLLGDRGTAKLNAPSNYTHSGVSIGGGLHL